MVSDHVHRIPKEADHLIDQPRYMTCHELEGSCHIEAQPGHHVTVLVSGKRPFPGIVRNKERDYKYNHVPIGTNFIFNIYDFKFQILDLSFCERNFIYRTEIMVQILEITRLANHSGVIGSE